MLTRPNGSIVWDVENRPVSMTVNGLTTTFTYDGDGNRVKQVIVGGNTTLYINKYFEKNLTTNTTTRYYYFGGKLVAMKQSSANVTYIHQDHLSGTSVMSDSVGNQLSAINYQPFGGSRNSQGNPGTDRLFTGQRLDSTGLYYYGARYYDPTIGRFISPDPIVQNYVNPQALNRYSYVFNNPLKYTDPTGLIVEFENEEEILAILAALAENGMDYAAGSDLDTMVQDWANDRLEWEELKELEREYTQHMIDSEITFNISDVDLLYKTVTVRVDLADMDFKDSIKLQLVGKGPVYGPTYPSYDLMRKLGNPEGLSMFPGLVHINTDYHYNTNHFTWLVAHEFYHQFEQTVIGPTWWFDYLLESRREHDLRTSEITANAYADRYPRY